MQKTINLYKRILDFIQRHNLIPPGETLLLGVSGGPDSLCLLYVLMELKEMLGVEPWERIVPDSRSRDEVLTLFKQIYPADKEKLGVIVLEFARI